MKIQKIILKAVVIFWGEVGEARPPPKYSKTLDITIKSIHKNLKLYLPLKIAARIVLCKLIVQCLKFMPKYEGYFFSQGPIIPKIRTTVRIR